MTDTQPIRSLRRDTGAKDERLEVLRLLESGTITAEEAAHLLDALDRPDRTPILPGDPTIPIDGPARHIRIRVSEGGQNRVNVTLPVRLLDAGFSIARRFAPDRIGDAAALREAILHGVRGPILDVQDGGERVEITVE